MMAIGQFMPMVAMSLPIVFEPVFSQALVTNSGTSYSNRLARIVIAPSRLSLSGKRIRVRFSPRTTTGNAIISSAFVAHQVSGGSAYNMDAESIKQLYFDGLPETTLTGNGASIWSDGAVFDLDKNRNLILSIGFGSGSLVRTAGSVANVTTYFWENSASSAGTLTMGNPGSTAASSIISADQIEVSQY